MFPFLPLFHMIFISSPLSFILTFSKLFLPFSFSYFSHSKKNAFQNSFHADRDCVIHCDIFPANPSLSAPYLLSELHYVRYLLNKNKQPLDPSVILFSFSVSTLSKVLPLSPVYDSSYLGLFYDPYRLLFVS